MVGKIDRGRVHVPVPEDARDGVYTVVAGDTLGGIARAFGSTVAALLSANPHIKDANRIFPGQRIAIGGAGPQGQGKDGVGPTTPTGTSTTQAATSSADASPHAASADAADEVAPTTAPVMDALEAPREPTRPVVAATGDKTPPAARTGAERVLGDAQKHLTRLLIDDRSFDKDIKLGTFGTGTVRLATSGTTDAGYDYARTKLAEQAAKDGKQAVFVRTEGALEIKGAHTFSRTREDGTTGGSLAVSANGSASFTLVRGHLVDKNAPDALALAKDMVRTSTVELPLSAERAKKMEPGSSFSLDLKGDAAADAQQDGAKLRAAANRSLEVHARFLGDNKVEVRVEREQHKEGRASVDRSRDDRRLSANANAVDDRSHTVQYTLDLSTPAGAAAYEALLKGKTRDADAASKTEGSGVERGWAWGSRTSERNAEVRAGVGGTDAQPTKIDGGVSASRTTTVDLESGTRTTRTKLAGDVDLSTPMGDGRALGLRADAERTAELTLPGTVKADTDVAMPLDAARARALPEGARLELRGKGTFGASVTSARDRQQTDDDGAVVSSTSTKFDAKLERQGDVDVRVTRGAGAEVSVDVTVRSTKTAGAEAARTHNKKGVSVGLSGSDKRTSIKEETASLTLDLDKPAHQRAYDAALRGDLGPARALGDDVVKDRALWSRDTRLGVELARGETLRLGAAWQREVLSADDWRVSMDGDRQALMTAAKERGEELSWVSVTTAVTPGARVSFGSVAKAGFDASGEWRVRAVLPGDRSSAIPDIPFKAEEALALPRGAEVSITGRAKVSSLWGVTHGADVEAAVARASASVSITHEHILVDRAIEVTAKRLDKNRVELRLDEARATGHTTGIEARVGVDVNLKAIPGAASVEKLPLGGTLLESAERKIDESLSISAGHSESRRTSSSKGITLTLDLSTPEAKRAYEAFLKGDASPALALAAKPKETPRADTPSTDKPAGDAPTTETAPAVTVDSRREARRTERGSRTHLTIAGDAIFLREALRSDTTTIESWGNGGATTTDVSTFFEKRKGLFSKGELTVEAVRIRTDDDPEGKGYFHVRVASKDTMTSRREMRESVALGEALGATPVRPIRVEADEKRGIKKVFGSAARHGTTHTELELFVTQKGIDELRARTGAEGARAYARYLERVDGKLPSWAGPDAAEARQMIASWNDKRSFNDRDAEDVRTAYWFKFKRNIWEDAETLESAQAIARAIDSMKKSEDPVSWNKSFADLGKTLKVDVTGAVAAINELVGSDEVLVHRFAVKGRSVDIEMKDEGLLGR